MSATPPIMWFRDGVREDADLQRYDAETAGLFLRVIERDSDEGFFSYDWGVSRVEHPPFEDDLAEECIARGTRRSARMAKAACRATVRRLTRMAGKRGRS